MNRSLRLLTLSAVLAAGLTFSGGALAFQPTTKEAKAAKSSSLPPLRRPPIKILPDAKAKGLVWVNTGTKVYHKDGEFYGKTKQGKFMTEADAQKAGFRAAKSPGGSKKVAHHRPQEVVRRPSTPL